MAKKLFIITIFNLLISIFSIIPLWNFENSTIDLLSTTNSYTYVIYSKNDDTSDIHVKLEKTITKTGDSITATNQIYIQNGDAIETNWENIESSYHIGDNIYICPKGKNHMNLYSNGDFTEMKSDDFSDTGNWELICYYQMNLNYMFVGYLNNYNKMYVYKFGSNPSTWVSETSTTFYSGLFDFKWTTTAVETNVYPMKFIGYDNNKLILKGTKFTLELNSNNINRNDIKSKDLIDTLTYSNAYFDSNNDYFYFITYDKEPPDFKSGYFNGATTIDYTNDYSMIESLVINTNNTSPLEFYYNFTIQSMNFNRNTRYVIYEIYNTVKEKTYHGIIDIILNKVIFNTDKNINKFIPYSSDSFLAITDNSAYKICVLSDGNNECISSCSDESQTIYVDSQRPNFCGTKCSKFFLVPIGICVDECDENIFHTEDNYHCGFCKDINSSYPYKLLNSSGCLNNIPEGTYLYNSKYNLLKGVITPTTILTTFFMPTTITSASIPKEDLCKREEGFYPVNYGNFTKIIEIECKNKNIINPRIYFDKKDEDFKPCYETCYKCEKEGNKTYHNCLECEPGFKFKPEGFPKNNCVADCPYYYYNLYGQYKCVDELPCPHSARLFIPSKNKCINDCKIDDMHKFQYNGNCYSKCPNGTIDNNYLCEDEKKFEFILTQNEISLNFSKFIENIDDYVQIYSKEYSYTNYHVTQYKGKEYDCIIFKNKTCIDELSLDFPNVNFRKCYEDVKSKYNINEDLIVAVVNKIDESNNPITYFSFFNPKSGEKLDTDVCNDDKILVVENISSFLDKNDPNYKSMMSLIEQGINIFNSSNDFFTDLCYEYEIKTDKDISLQDRLKLFYPNLSLCDSGCTQKSINLEKMTANCECDFKDLSASNKKKFKEEIEILENLFGDVIDAIDASNIEVGKCINQSKKKILKCYGTYITLVLLIITIIFSIIFYVNDLDKIKIYIYNITHNFIRLFFNIKADLKFGNPPSKKKKNKNKNIENNNHKIGDDITNIKINVKNIKKEKDKRPKTLINNNLESLRILSNQNKSIQNEQNSKDNMLSSFKNKNNFVRSSFEKGKNGEKNKIFEKINPDLEKYKLFFEEYFESSPDEMEFDDAIIKDKRKFCIYFIDKLKDEQIICNTFISYDPLKPRSIKIILFVLNILLYFVVNALFINDDYISQVYNLEEKDNFFSFIPRSLERITYTTFINIIIRYVVDFFFVEEKRMKRIYLREKDNKLVIKEQIINLMRTIKINYIAFTIFVFFIFIICLYYLICFNSIYPKIQVEWIKSSIFIFLIIQIISVLQYLLETILRFISFRFESERIFKISKLVN